MNKCVVCCPVSEGCLDIDKAIDNMEKMGEVFSDYRVLIFYDGASSYTLDTILERMNNNERINLLVNATYKSKRETTHNLANARNKLLEKALMSDFEYLIMMDCDANSTLPVNLAVLERCISRKDWNGMTFCLRNGETNLAHLSLDNAIMGVDNFNDPITKSIYRKEIEKRLANTTSNKLLRVFSAFNSLAIYRLQKFRQSRYDGKPRRDYVPSFLVERTPKMLGNIVYRPTSHGEEEQDSEHRAFHLHAVMKYNAKMCISPECIF